MSTRGEGRDDGGAANVLLWRSRALWSLIVFLAAVLLLDRGDDALVGETGGPLQGLLLLLLGLVAVGASVGCLHNLFVFAARHGGRRYALAQTATALLLTPVLIGIVFIPPLVISDVEKRVAEWRHEHEPPLSSVVPETVIWTLFGFGVPWIAVMGLGGWGIPIGLAAGLCAARALIAMLRAEDR